MVFFLSCFSYGQIFNYLVLHESVVGLGGGGERSGAQAKQSSHTGVKEKDEIVSYTSSHMSQGYSFKDRCTCNKRMFFCRAF